MGFFSKIKDNLHHGGVTVNLQAPALVAANTPFAVTVSIASASPQTINGVKVQVEARTQRRVQNTAINGVGPTSNEESYTEIVAQAESHASFTIAPGEHKTVELQVVVSGGGPGMLNAVGGGLGKALNALEKITTPNIRYSLHAHVDVADIALDPHVQQPLQLTAQTDEVQPPAVQSAIPPAAVTPQPPAAPALPEPPAAPAPPNLNVPPTQ